MIYVVECGYKQEQPDLVQRGKHELAILSPVLMTRHFNYHKCEWLSTPVVSRWLGPGYRTFLEVARIVVT